MIPIQPFVEINKNIERLIAILENGITVRCEKCMNPEDTFALSDLVRQINAASEKGEKRK